MNHWINLLVWVRMTLVGCFLWRPFIRKTHHPLRTQMKLLRQILRENRDTTFGRKYGFSSIKTEEDFSARVPIQTYEDLRPWIERQDRDKTSELLDDQPFMYAQTSGTTGAPKYIPITRGALHRYQRTQKVFSYCHYSAIPKLFRGKILAFVSPAIEGRLPSGTPFGSMSGLIYRSMPRLLKNKYFVPAEVFACNDHELKYLLIATFAAAERDISYIAGANPSTFLKIVRVLRSKTTSILAAVRSGVLPGQEMLAPEMYRELSSAFRANIKRAEELEHLLADNAPVTLQMLWPSLVAVSCWREGSCRVLLPKLQCELGKNVPILELGYLASECRGSVSVDSRRHLEVPNLGDVYFEFVERSDWESGNQTVRTLTQLEIGQTYHVIITTTTGLYRYFMNDLVVVNGKFGQTPTIKFLEKGSGVTSITGEKLYESQLCAAVETLQKSEEWTPDFFMLVADTSKQKYLFYYEADTSVSSGWIEQLDRELASLNLEYKSKRDSDRLYPIEPRLLRKGTGENYKAHLVDRGQREAQFKYLRLQDSTKLSFDFEPYIIIADES